MCSRLYRSCTSAVDNASPARLMVRTVAGRLPESSKVRAADGTVLIRRTRSRAESLGKSSAELANNTVPPWLSVANSSNTERSKEIDVDANTPLHSSALNTLPAQAINVVALRCSMTTPLGLPVEPDV